MPGNKYVISARAKADIKAIARYTLENFGKNQSLKYAQGLKELLEELAQNPDLGSRYIAVKDQMVLRYRYKSHVIFYFIHNEKIFIVRVLGGMMDFSKHL